MQKETLLTYRIEIKSKPFLLKDLRPNKNVKYDEKNKNFSDLTVVFFIASLLISILIFPSGGSLEDGLGYLTIPVTFVLQSYALLMWLKLFFNNENRTVEELWLVTFATTTAFGTSIVLVYFWHITTLVATILASFCVAGILKKLHLSERFYFWIWLITLTALIEFAVICSTIPPFVIFSSFLKNNIINQLVLYVFLLFTSTYVICDAIPLNIDELDPDFKQRDKSFFYKIKKKFHQNK